MKRNEFMDFLCWVFYEDVTEVAGIVFIIFFVALPLGAFIAGLFQAIAFLGILVSVLIGTIVLFGMYKLNNYYLEKKNPW